MCIDDNQAVSLLAFLFPSLVLESERDGLNTAVALALAEIAEKN